MLRFCFSSQHSSLTRLLTKLRAKRTKVNNTIDTIKAVITYVTAAIVVVGGVAALVFIRMDGETQTIVFGLVSGASVFLFGQETATRTARQVIASAQTNGNQAQTLKSA